MSIYLKDIDEENWLKIIMLTTNKDGNHSIFEEFVASNALSIAQSKIEKGWIIKGIYNNDEIIGFTMYGYCQKTKFYELCRFMIDYRYQGNGYGKEALKIIIEEMKKIEGCKEIYLSTDEKNVIGKSIYEKIGFKNTGRFIDGEALYALPLYDDMVHEKSCGGIVYKSVNKEIKYLLLKSIGTDGYWGFPKGHIEYLETEEETALREIFEECGLKVKLVEGFRTTDSYIINDIAEKEVVLFLGEADNDSLTKIQAEEIEDYRWCNYEEAQSLLTFDNGRRILHEANKFLSNSINGVD